MAGTNQAALGASVVVIDDDCGMLLQQPCLLRSVYGQVAWWDRDLRMP
jgi:hypothetical protein